MNDHERLTSVESHSESQAVSHFHERAGFGTIRTVGDGRGRLFRIWAGQYDAC